VYSEKTVGVTKTTNKIKRFFKDLSLIGVVANAELVSHVHTAA
jgi:hypothetical protein